MSRIRTTYRSLAVVGVACAAVGIVLLVSSGRGGPSSALTYADVLGSAFVALAVMVLAAGALLRAGRR